LGIVMSALLLTKGTALPMLALVVAAFALRAKRFGLRRTGKAAAATGLLLLPGLAWWVANVVRFGALQPDGYPRSYLDLLTKRGDLSLGSWLHGFFPALFRSFFADFGWLEAPPPSAVTAAATIVLGLLLAVGVVRARGNLGGALLAQLAWLTPLIAIMYTSHAASERTGALQGVQGRYIFGGVAAIAATLACALRPGQGGRRGRPWLPFALLPIAAAAVAAIGLWAGVAHFYTGDGFLGQIGVFSAWSPLRLRALAAVGAVCALCALAAAALLARRDAPEYSRSPAARRADVGVSARP
jgi:hypothetical protein